jgi:demethylmenaquinone methyltransferase/2-methoxy-6-polyprenyl-1,4-benzoquinol methylase
MFDRIAPGYDRVNQVMTMGLDGGWRRAAASMAALGPGATALDLGAGTGDLSFALARSAPDVHVIGMDYAVRMLAAAPRKARSAGLAAHTSWLAGDGHRLPFADHSFDAVASAFVLRNLADLPAAFAEMRRVLVPGGRCVALEASPGGGLVWRALAALHFRTVVPVLGLLVTGDRRAYTYLGDSVASFLTPGEVATAMAATGLAPEPALLLAGGTIVVHIATKPA